MWVGRAVEFVEAKVVHLETVLGMAVKRCACCIYYKLVMSVLPTTFPSFDERCSKKHEILGPPSMHSVIKSSDTSRRLPVSDVIVSNTLVSRCFDKSEEAAIAARRALSRVKDRDPR